MALGGSSVKQPTSNAGGGTMSNVVTDESSRGSLPPCPPPGTLRLWIEVANGIDKSQTVVWKNAVDSLEEALRYFLTNTDARRFVEGHMRPVISILLEQQPSKIGQMEKNCVEESLRWAVSIVAEDLKAKASPSADDCTVIDVLAMVFNRKKIFYKGSKPSWNVSLIGLPEVRQHTIQKFRGLRGFSALATYLGNRINKKHTFPSHDVLHQLISATVDAIPIETNVQDANSNSSAKVKNMEDDALHIADAVMEYMRGASEESLKRQAHESLNTLRYDVQRIFEKLAPTRRKEVYAFYEFWRGLTLKLITSQSLPLKLFGWEQVGELIDASSDMRPPPKGFVVSGAGCTFVNGEYIYSGPLTDDGFARLNGEIQYLRKIPESFPERDGGGKTLTLFRCTMRSHQKWWFLSEADEEQPGTDKDIDYYSHKSKAHEESEPPRSGWTTCRNDGIEPSPMFRSCGLMVPNGEEFNTLEHQLAKWAIDNKVIELVFGDSVHREIVSRSTSLIKFLASMCDRDEPIGDDAPPQTLLPNKYCLQASHLLLAWKNCTSKADAAVSAEIYQLLVLILPSLRDYLAIQLLSTIRESLRNSTHKQDYMFEVAEFCAALANTNNLEAEAGNITNANANAPPNFVLSDNVRAEVLNLLWEILSHPEASSLKPYDRLKSYVTNELRVEPMGKVHREKFLGSCKVALTDNAMHDGSAPSTDVVDEVVALGIVKLTLFVLEACPREHAISFVTADNAALTDLLFRELTAYLKRRATTSADSKKSSSSSFENNHPSAISERFNFLRFSYGLSEAADMSTIQLDDLWALCSHPADRETLMVFLASSSCIDVGNNASVTEATQPCANDSAIQLQSNNSAFPPADKQQPPLTTAFSEKVRNHIFQHLFCSPVVDWEKLGEGAYQSFQMFFKLLKQDKGVSFSSNASAIDTLWRICLRAGNDDVAGHAMNDLLAIYISLGASDNPNIDPIADTELVSTDISADNTPNMANHYAQPADIKMKIDPVDPSSNKSESSFAHRVFQCLVQVKDGLLKNLPSSERSAERCLKILNSAVGQDFGIFGQGTSDIAVAALRQLSPNMSVEEAMRVIPHGMCGQASYRSVGVVAKRASNQNTVGAAGTSSNVGNIPSSSAAGSTSQLSTLRLPSVVRFTLEVHPLETLSSIKMKVASNCHHRVSLVKPTSVTGRQAGYNLRPTGAVGGDSNNMSLSVVPDDSTVSQLGFTDGCEIIFFLAGTPFPTNTSVSSVKHLIKTNKGLDLSVFFEAESSKGFADQFFDTLLSVLEALPSKENKMFVNDSISNGAACDTHKLVWDLLLSMPTNVGIVSQVRSAASRLNDIVSNAKPVSPDSNDKMVLDSSSLDQIWSELLNVSCFHRSVYVLQVIDSLLQPAPEILSCLPEVTASPLQRQMLTNTSSFRKGFVKSGGFDAVLGFFTVKGLSELLGKDRTRMGNAVALRVLKCGFLGSSTRIGDGSGSMHQPDEIGKSLLSNLSDPKAFLFSLSSVAVCDHGVSDSTILNVLFLLRHLFIFDSSMTNIFASLPNRMGEKLITTLLLWECAGTVSIATVNAGTRVRKNMQDLILAIPALARCCVPWLILSLQDIDVGSEATNEFFSVLRKLVEGCGSTKMTSIATDTQLKELATAVCTKLASHPRPTSDSAIIDFSTGVLCGCFELIRALIETAGGAAFLDGTTLLTSAVAASCWSKVTHDSVAGSFSVSLESRNSLSLEDTALIDLMGAIFDGFLSSASSSSSTAICCDKISRQLGFDVLAAAARSAEGNFGYYLLVTRVLKIIKLSSPALRHVWSYSTSPDDGHNRAHGLSKYSGLRNQGCTCYMNSVLQQLFMMPGLRKILCSASLPSSLRSAGSCLITKGSDLIGKRISIHWESGVLYEALVEGFDEATGMHSILYYVLPVSNANQGVVADQVHHHQQIRQEELTCFPKELPDEFILSEGRPGKETGAFDVMHGNGTNDTNDGWNDGAVGDVYGSGRASNNIAGSEIEESEEESSTRRLLEEVQRTFVHLEEGSRGRCFDPRSLVEASGCLKLEFDVWQQNDASEYAMKLLDRLEVPLKRWAPRHFKYLTHTFGLKQTKQKICKECGLKTNREENLMNIDCQIRGKADIHEALSTMCEVEFMEGDNKVFCDRCKEKRDTVLRTAISALPNVLVLSLKRFDLDYTTFETVKLNSRCAFGQTLNMKRYTLEGVEALEKSEVSINGSSGGDAMETEDGLEYPPDDPLRSLPDEDYEYKLAGVLVHAGVAQGGHYYSFIKDRSPAPGEEVDKWYRFDDEDVSHFDPNSIEVECFGGKVKKETKWPNGQVHTVESEQFANALMLFYEKVKPVQMLPEDNVMKENSRIEDMEQSDDSTLLSSSGYDVFQLDVRKSNTTHCWHTFLFDAEFQAFLKGLLGLCLMQSPVVNDIDDKMDMSLATPSPTTSPISRDSSGVGWHMAMLQMCLSFVFDILLHSVDRDSISDWMKRIIDALTHDNLGAKWFIHELARRTHKVSSNWLRVYCLDCPEEFSRHIAISIFCAAIHSCFVFPQEQNALSKWSAAWKLQTDAHQKNLTGRRQNVVPLPTKLEGSWEINENLKGLDNGSSSSIGIILSSLSGLIEVAPRTHCHNSDFSLFIRELATIENEFGGDVMRIALIESQYPARFISFLIRDRAPPSLRAAFPGSSLSYEVAEALVKNETPPSSHMLPLTGSSVGVGGVNNGTSNSSVPSITDRLNLFDALGCMIEVPGVKRTALVCETDLSSKGRSYVALTVMAQEALSLIFNESKSSVHGMGQRDIQSYMQNCGLDTSVVPQQKIASILSKYPSTSIVGNDSGKECRYLSLDGFLQYYRDTAQTNESQVRSDLHTFGFRLNLSRRPDDIRWFVQGGHQQFYQIAESVAHDVALFGKERSHTNFGIFAEHGLQSYSLHSLAYSTSEPLAEYLLATVSQAKDSNRLIIDTLKELIRAPTGWGGTEILNSCIMILKVLVAIPDSRQIERITTIMQSREKSIPHAETGVGILVTAKDMSASRVSQHYSADFHYSIVERYISAVKELYKFRKVQEWMTKNRELWMWMDQWLRTEGAGQQQIRNDFSGRDGAIHPPPAPLSHHHSDSEMNTGIGHDSEEEDDDSRYEQVDNFNVTGKAIVRGAGVPAVNGAYIFSDSYDGVGKYMKEGIWKGQEEVFSLFRCQLSDHTRRWYISIVPKNHIPGTNKDIDFYSAPAINNERETPPERWQAAKEGIEPAPICIWKLDAHDEDEEDDSGGRDWSGEDGDGNRDLGFL